MSAGMVRPILRGITLSGRAERAGYDLVLVRRAPRAQLNDAIEYGAPIDALS
jgi:hypothetical protein